MQVVILIGILIGFLFAYYIGASIVRSIRGYAPPPAANSKKFNHVKERNQ